MGAFRQWLIMTCLCLSSGIIFFLPFLRELYHIPMQKALHLTNTQLGVLMSAYGIAATSTHFPGGWLADRVRPRKLLTISMLSTGIAGLYFATFPPYPVCIALHAFWGVSTTLTFWGALIKSIRKWASSAEQGRAFGIQEGGRGITEAVSTTALLAVFAKLGSDNFALSQVIILFSVLNILIGIMIWFSLKDSPRDKSEIEEEKLKIGLKEVIKVLKMPVVWLIAVVILSAYSAYWGSYYFTPYATTVFMMSVVFGGALGAGKFWFKLLPALGAGFLGDKIGASKTCALSFVILILSFGVFAFVPGSPELVLILVINTAIASLAIFALRGIYFALLEEGGVPLALTGTAAGTVSFIAYTPDIYMPMIGGILLDGYPGALGYRYLFIIIGGMCGLGFLAAITIMRKFAKKMGNLRSDTRMAN